MNYIRFEDTSRYGKETHCERCGKTHARYHIRLKDGRDITLCKDCYESWEENEK